MIDAHEVVVLVLDRGAGDGSLGAELLEVLGQTGRPQNGHVGLGAGAHVLERVQVAVAHLGNERTAVDTHAADGLGDPLRVAGEQGLVLGGTGKLDHAELHDEVIHELLDLLLGEGTVGKVALSIDVDERRGTADGHSGAVLLLDGSKVGEVHPLDGLLRVGSRVGNIETIGLGHHLELAEGADLLLQLLAIADVVGGHDRRSGSLLGLLVLDQVVDAVQGNTTVVADDAAAAIAIGQTGDDVSRAASTHLGGVDIEDASVVGLALEGVALDNVLVDLVAVLAGSLASDADTTVDVQRALERLVGLEANNGLLVAMGIIDVASGVAHDTRDGLGVHIEDTTLLALLKQQVENLAPQLLGTLGRTYEERLIALVGGVVLLDEVSDVNLSRPDTFLEAFPCLLHCVTTLLVTCNAALSHTAAY